MRYLSICTICQNEGKYLPEWISYHQKVGVEHFYLYENDSTDNTLAVLNRYPSNLVTVRRIHGNPKQFEACLHCLNTNRNDSRWIAFIDVDEFLVPHHVADLKELLKEYEKWPALCVHWYLFGSNGEKTYTPFPVIERFPKRQSDVNPHVKSIIDPKRSFNLHTVHRFTHNNLAVDENKHFVPEKEPLPPNGTCNIIQLNHYAVKSYEECTERRSRKRADTGTLRDIEEFFKHHDRNEVEDLRAFEIWKS